MFHNTDRKANGYIIMVDADGKTTERDTIQCCHCGGHWEVNPGSGTVRGWCTKCHARHCGSKACMVCIPTDLLLDLREKAEKASLIISGE